MGKHQQVGSGGKQHCLPADLCGKLFLAGFPFIGELGNSFQDFFLRTLITRETLSKHIIQVISRERKGQCPEEAFPRWAIENRELARHEPQRGERQEGGSEKACGHVGQAGGGACWSTAKGCEDSQEL